MTKKIQNFQSRGLWQLKNMASEQWNDLCREASHKLGTLGYGCWCGKGPSPLSSTISNRSMDSFDRLCNIHDYCYYANRKHHDCPRTNVLTSLFLNTDSYAYDY